MNPLISVEDALNTLLQAVIPSTQQENLGLIQANGRILAVDMVSPLNVPGFDNSAMDGYAFRLADATETPPRFPVSQRIPAGFKAEYLDEGTAARIFTGAQIPEGADVVVMQEQCELIAGGKVQINAPVTLGQNIRRAGEDIAENAVVLKAGTRLRPQELGLLASIGIAQVPVRVQPKVAVFFTGDEIVEPGKPLAAGQIYNSNRYMIVALLQNLGCVVTDLGSVRDNLESTRHALRQAASGHDVVLTCGGVSVGEEDHVKAAVEAEGALNLWQIAIKPGKPLAFGRVGEAHFIGLPGNPVSSFVTFKILVEPFLKTLMGDTHTTQPIPVTVGFDWPRADKRREFLRVRLEQVDGQTVAMPFKHQGSGVLTSCSFADGLLEVNPGETFSKGDVRMYWGF